MVLTDEKGKAVQEYEYDSFGNMKDRKNKVKQPYAFTGREWDRDAKLYYYRARYYEPNVGRFISFDPILRGVGNLEGTGCSQTVSSLPLQGPQELNAYTYTTNNPINFTDPYGLNIYGNWCGPGGSGNIKDSIDRCCYEHDMCYREKGLDWIDKIFGAGDDNCKKKCDNDLCQCLNQYKPMNEEENKAHKRIMWFFNCER